MNHRCLLIVLSCFLLLAGCAPFSARHDWQSPPVAEELMARVLAGSGRNQSLDASASVGLSVQGKYVSSQQFLLLERPDRLRADVLTGFGQLALQIASDGQAMAVFLNNTVPGRYYAGPASYENMSRFVRVPLKADDLIPLLLYDPPLVGYGDRHVEIEGDRVRLTLSGENVVQDLYFDSQLTLVGCAYRNEQQTVLNVSYDNFETGSGFPLKVKIELPTEDTKMTVKFKDLKLNIALDADQFTLAQPTGSVFEALP